LVVAVDIGAVVPLEEGRGVAGILVMGMGAFVAGGLVTVMVFDGAAAERTAGTKSKSVTQAATSRTLSLGPVVFGVGMVVC
jgi:hypothetical protein